MANTVIFTDINIFPEYIIAHKYLSHQRQAPLSSTRSNVVLTDRYMLVGKVERECHKWLHYAINYTFIDAFCYIMTYKPVLSNIKISNIIYVFL